ncbi:MAG: hypothetical protein M3Y37_07605 [Chloroflexota bacterium]|jgi:hypothetical protein|nr:hypothetical protein [Chloroflexota bacterium]
MKLPFGTRNLVVTIEHGAAPIEAESAMIEASDREIEQIARNHNKVREPRWEATALTYGWHL